MAHPFSLDGPVQTPPEPTAIWHVETVDGAATVGKVTSLALDSLGRPHIAYRGRIYLPLIVRSP